jgi:hypothetical protein
MALRIMLPSKARVGDTIHFAFPNVPGKVINAFHVKINGKSVTEPATIMTRAKGGGAANFVFKVTDPGTYQFEITPIGPAGEKGEPRLNTLEVTP